MGKRFLFPGAASEISAIPLEPASGGGGGGGGGASNEAVPWIKKSIAVIPLPEAEAVAMRWRPSMSPVVNSGGGLGGQIAWRLIRRIEQPELLPKVDPARRFPVHVLNPRPANPRPVGYVKPLLARDPRVDQRLRRFTELLTSLVNSLVGGGYFEQTSPDKWVITQPPFDESRDPNLMDDVNAGVAKGMCWYNNITGALWYCVRDTAGSALWVKVN